MRPTDAWKAYDMGAFTYWYRHDVKRLDKVLERLGALGADADAIAQARQVVAELRPDIASDHVYGAGPVFDALTGANHVAFGEARSLAVQAGDADLVTHLHRHGWPSRHGLDQDLHLRRPSEVLREAELLLTGRPAADPRGRHAPLHRADVAARLLRHLDPAAVPPAHVPEDAARRLEQLQVIAASIRARVGDDADAIDAAWAEGRSLFQASPGVEANAVGARVAGAAAVVAERFPGVDALAGAARITEPLVDEAALVRMQHEARWIARAFEEHADPEVAAAASRLADELAEQQVQRGAIDFWASQVSRDVDASLVGDAAHVLRDPAATIQAHGARDLELASALAALQERAVADRAAMRSVLDLAAASPRMPVEARGAAMAALGRLSDAAAARPPDAVARALGSGWDADVHAVADAALGLRARLAATHTGAATEAIAADALRVGEQVAVEREALARQVELLADAAMRGRITGIERIERLSQRLADELDQLEVVGGRLP